jgi:hypothetical protein
VGGFNSYLGVRKYQKVENPWCKALQHWQNIKRIQTLCANVSPHWFYMQCFDTNLTDVCYTLVNILKMLLLVSIGKTLHGKTEKRK